MGPMPVPTSMARPAIPSITRLLGLILTGLLAALVIGSAAASAESPSRVADGLVDDGVFVGFGRSDVDEAALAAAVSDARADGLDLVVVVPRDPQPSAKAFARRIQERTEADVAIVFPSDGPLEAYVIDELSAARPRAIEAARILDDPARAVVTFADELTTSDSTGRPPIVGQIIRALVICSLLIGAVVAIELAIGRVKGAAPVS